MLRFLSFAIGLSSLLLPSLAVASTVVSKPGGFVAVSDERLAFSSNKERTVSFEQLRLDSASGELAWLVPVPKDAIVEFGDPAFFVGLDASTAPVLGPSSALHCGNALFSTAEPHDEPPPQKALSVSVVDGSHAASVLSMAGYAVDAAVRAELLDVEKSGERVAIVEIAAGATTPMIRVIGPSGRAMPTMLLAAPLARLQGFVIGEQRMKLDSATTFQLDFDRVRWDDAGPNFTALLDQTLTAASDGIVVTFASYQGLLSRQIGIPSVAERYLTDAECVTRALASANSTEKVVSGTPATGELAAATFTCGKRDDLSAALVGLAPSSTWITRFEALDPGIDGRLATDGTVPVPSYHDVVLGGCTQVVTHPSDPGTPNGPSSGSDQNDSTAAHVAADACLIGLDSCSRSSSDSSSSGCSGDSSSSSNGCGGDSSSSSGGCGGSSSSSGDSCSSGPHTSSADDGCRISYKPRRVRLSPIVLGLAAFATILRRRTRRAV
ncbi:MAG: DUF2330 domain-containing protein [Polyangiales bacterium]